ncbi:MAG TPA: hypothetical protein VMT45_05280 [Thermoanaerobaculaceae bacterium]|nr:hypothetical protein [Thermoanaerobaculaceae bacterium]
MAALLIADADALETDQYYTWGQPLGDATTTLNAKMNLEIARALQAIQVSSRGQPPTCRAIARELRGRLHLVILQPIEVWVTHSPLVPRLPATPEEELSFRRDNLNGNHGPFDTGRWIPDSPTVEVNGVRFGTDKISHFVSSGWRYHEKYLTARKRGLSAVQATEAAVEWGVLEERTTNGLLTDGVFSRGDLEANLGGMRFYLDLCDGPDALLALDGDHWKVRRPFDWRDYVTPRWDESYNVSIYTASRWRKVRPRLLGYCSRRNDPDVVERLSRYRATDRPSLSDLEVAKAVKDGELPDPSRFTLETNCPAIASRENVTPSVPDKAPAAPSAGAPAPSREPEGLEPLESEIAAREAHTQRRAYTLAGARFTSYEGLAGSVGWMFTDVESDFDCHTICDLHGPTVQLQPGLDGAQVSLGYARIFGETGHSERFLVSPYLGAGVRGTVLRTWREGNLGPPGLTYAGLEGQFTITSVSFTLGALWHVGGGSAAHDWAITWGFGWGF